MSAPLLRHREWWLWALAFVFVSALLVSINFKSDDPDSALYADLSARMGAGPVAAWIAPEWWGNWDGEGLFREHPVGVFVLPTILAALGVPGIQAAYIVGMGAGLASLLLIANVVRRTVSPDASRWVLVLLQLMPVASIFRIRSNHEYPMLVCLLVALIGVDRVRRSWSSIWILPLACVAGLLVKGVFVVIIALAAGLWALTNPMRERGSILRPIVAGLAAIVAMVLVAYGYDALYIRQTGESFWAGYWQRQLGPLTVSTPLSGGQTLASHLLFYLVRVAWHPAPWSALLIGALWRHRGSLRTDWANVPDTARRALLFAVAFAICSILALSPASRFAERYAFSANFAIGAAGAVVACFEWPRLGRWLSALDARVPALPVLTWTALMLMRLGLGPFLPRISS